MAMEEGMEKRNARAGQELQRNESEKKRKYKNNEWEGESMRIQRLQYSFNTRKLDAPDDLGRTFIGAYPPSSFS